MSPGQQILFFFSALGAFNGFILGIYLLIFKKQKSAASYFLGLMLLALSIRITKAILGYFYHDLPKIYLQIGLSGCFLIGPSLYYFTRAALSQLREVPIRWKYSYAALVLLITFTGVIVPYQSHPWDWNHYIVHVIYGQWAIYFCLTGWELRSQMGSIFSSRKKLSPSEVSILSVFGANAVIFLAYLIVFIWASSSVYITGAVFFSLLLYLNVPLFLNRNKSTTNFLGTTEPPPRYGNKKIDPEQAQMLAVKLETIITRDELFQDPDLKLSDLAKTANIPSHQLSQLLNDNLGMSFSAYLNSYRIKAACLLLSGDSPLKLEEIGYQVGFNSKSTFYAAFKKHLGTTPTLYRDSITAQTGQSPSTKL